MSMTLEENQARTVPHLLRQVLARIAEDAQRRVVPITTPSADAPLPCAYINVLDDIATPLTGRRTETLRTKFRIGVLFDSPLDRGDILEERGDVERHNLKRAILRYRIDERDRLTTDQVDAAVTGFSELRTWTAEQERQDRGWVICEGYIEAVVEYKT